MDRKTISVLNDVVRELFEDAKTGIGVQGEGGPVIVNEPAANPSPLQKAKDEVAYQLANENTRRNWAIDDFLYRANKVNTAAQAVSDDAEKVKAAREAKDAMLQRIREHNPKTGPDPALGRKLEFDYEVARHNPKDPADPTWYQQGWNWVSENPGYAALAAGAPIALAAGAYYLNKRRKGNK